MTAKRLELRWLRFRWADVLNKRRLTLTPHLEGCQSICRGKKQCKTGTWQVGESMQTPLTTPLLLLSLVGRSRMYALEEQ